MKKSTHAPWRKAIISIDQFSRNDISELFKLAKKSTWDNPLAGKILVNLFYEPSTRTSSSFHAAMLRLGGSVIPVNEVHYSSVSKGETLEDTVRTFESYAHGIVLRHPESDAAQRAAKICQIPIVNAGNGAGEHPTQTLLDLYTIYRERGQIDGLTVTMMGDLKHGRTVHSLVKALRQYDVTINFVSPPELNMPSEYCEHWDGVFTDLSEIISDTDVLYVTRVQKERMNDGVLIDTDYALTRENMDQAKSDMTLMHPLPRVGEIPVEFDNDPRSAYFRQMKYGLYIRMALLSEML
jgi:aspartate carbamoyltransferase catalytic subunit